jgi:2-dehydropantoate 2-reductase
MNILVCGAGVIGTLYAAKLRDAGHQVTVLARSTRLAEIQNHGLALEDVVSGSQSTTQVTVTQQLNAEDKYDLALVTVRRDQLSSILPALAANRNIPTILFMLNNPLGSAALVEALGAERVLLGFPGAGGARDGHVVRYALIAQQPTTLGAPASNTKSGAILSAPLRTLAELFRASGFPARIDSNMEAWLTSHAFFVTAVSGAIYIAAGQCDQLSRSEESLALMVSGVREGFNAVRALGRPVHPFALNVLFMWLPRSFAIRYWRGFFAKPMAEYAFGRHVRSASAEIRMLADDCRQLLTASAAAAPALDQLYRAVNDYVAEHARQDSLSA